MKATYEGVRISGILTVVPERKHSMEVGKEFNKRRCVKEDTLITDMYCYGLNEILQNNWLRKEEIGAVVVLTLTPDYLIPNVSSILHGRFDLPEDVICLDIPQDCAAYPVGILQSSMLLQHMEKKVVLFTGSMLSKMESDKNPGMQETAMGEDAVSITILEREKQGGRWYFASKSYCKTRDCLTMPDSEIMRFAGQDVPAMIQELCGDAKIEKSDVDFFLFQQPDHKVLEKIADFMGISEEKMLMETTGRYRGADSSAIPMVMTEYMAETFMKEEQRYCCLCGFGSGILCAMVLMKIGNLDFCQMVESDL